MAQEGGHQSLMFHRDHKGREQPITEAAHWKIRRQAIIKGMEAAMGDLPSRENLPALEMRIEETLLTSRYTRQKISYLAEKGDWVPAYLYLPLSRKDDGKLRPAMLALHPTSPLGKGVVDGQGEKPNRAYGKELAELGYVVLAPDYPSFGDYKGYDFGKDRYASASMKGIFNHMRGVDLLVARGDVDPDRIGVIGHSLGGHNAIFVGVFDVRLKVIVTSCGWTPFHDYYGGKLDGWAQDKYMPRIRTRYELDPDRMPFDFHELVGALAPRAYLTNSPIHDHNFSVAGVKKAMTEVRKVYDLLHASERLVARYPEAGHDFPPEVRKEAYEFIGKVLQK
jgi:acetyl esterase/lipase